jgi:hypothetical protein
VNNLIIARKLRLFPNHEENIQFCAMKAGILSEEGKASSLLLTANNFLFRFLAF